VDTNTAHPNHNLEKARSPRLKLALPHLSARLCMCLILLLFLVPLLQRDLHHQWRILLQNSALLHLLLRVTLLQQHPPHQRWALLLDDVE